MHSSLHSAAVAGAGACPVDVQVDLALGLPAFHVAGLPDHACNDARIRVQTALRNSGYQLPQKKVTVNLAPGDLRKEGASFDLPIALGVLVASGLMPPPDRPALVVGELALSGDVLPVRGVLPIAIEARRMNVGTLIVPEENACEGALVKGVRVFGARSLVEAAEIFGGTSARPPAGAPRATGERVSGLDLADVRGQETAKWAMKIAAAGGHNALFIGPPGAGKTMLARRLPTLLPALSFEEAVEATSIWSIAGRLKPGQGLINEPPFRAPHHTISVAGLVGGGTPLRAGEISLAHCGALFLDELPEFGRSTLEALRQPLEDGEVTIVRTRERATLPARFMLLAAMNPCPCGHASDQDPSRCVCTLPQKQQYMARISGPILDRFDLHVEAPALKSKEMLAAPAGDSSATVREQVERARALQRERYARLPGIRCNAQLRGAALRELTRTTAQARGVLAGFLDAKKFSARAHDRVLKVARTLADLEGSDCVNEHHVQSASEFRCLDKPLTGHLGRNDALENMRRRALRKPSDSSEEMTGGTT
ncbi:MAG TPA: YifB family Mg chelatase-like AAA ATPase [Myxococcales bacterium]|nr:YifB family Mg chelatase-like AAA ATPase [Myxococcales bacterium]